MSNNNSTTLFIEEGENITIWGQILPIKEGQIVYIDKKRKGSKPFQVIGSPNLVIHTEPASSHLDDKISIDLEVYLQEIKNS